MNTIIYGSLSEPPEINTGGNIEINGPIFNTLLMVLAGLLIMLLISGVLYVILEELSSKKYY